jgi:hypothetical protein
MEQKIWTNWKEMVLLTFCRQWEACSLYFPSNLLIKHMIYLTLPRKILVDISMMQLDGFQMLLIIMEKYLSIGKYIQICIHFYNIYSWAGISRSSSFCIAFLMYKMNLNIDSATLLCRKARSIIYPNPGFSR